MTDYRRVPFLTFVVSPYQKVKINLAGCNFDCKACFAIAKREVGRELTVEELIDLLIKSCQRIYGKLVDDVQITGGEPTVNTDYLLYLIRRLRELHASQIGISTNSYLLDRNLIEELKFWGVNYIKLDLKAYSDEIHKWYTGRSNINVLKAVQLLSEYGLNFYVRTIYTPDMVENDEIEKIARFLSQIDRNISYKIYQFAPEYTNNDILRRSPTHEEMLTAGNTAKRYLANAEAYTISTAYEPAYKYIEVRADELLEDFRKIDKISKSVITGWDMPYLTMNQILTS
ncbi:MAG: radical SAM protein [Dehalococcoidales bacterium]